MRSAIAILVLVIALAIGARSCAEKEKKLLVKKAPEPPTKVMAARHPASPYQWTLTEKGLGPVQLGMKREDVEAAIGEPFRVGPGGHDKCGNADWPGAPTGVGVVIGNGVVRRITVDVYGAGLQTDAGISIGTDSQTVANIYTALGKPLSSSARSNVILVNLTPALTPASGLAVMLSNHKVWALELGYVHEIDNGNVCG
jgi:hypothetical protein